MGNSKLYQQPVSQFRLSNLFDVCIRGLSGILDDIISEVVTMAEYKLAFFILTIIGIPAYIYAWFLDATGPFEVWKGIVLTCIGAFTGAVIGFRQLVKLMSEYEDLKKKKREFKRK